MTARPAVPSAAAPAAHVSIDTADLARSLAFYGALLDAEPVVHAEDYARFRLPGLVLGLNARPPAGSATGPLEHLGLLYPDAQGLAAARARLERAGFATSGEEHVECCHAELDQHWASDPSGVRWELFLAHREIVERPAPAACCTPTCCP